MSALHFPEEMAQYPEEWIALSDDNKLLGHGKTPEDAIASAGVDKKMITLYYYDGNPGPRLPSVSLSKEIPIRVSPTVQLAIDIEMMTGSAWSQGQRYEVAELIRKYRFEQVSGVLARVHQLVRESGNTALTEKIYLGKF